MNDLTSTKINFLKELGTETTLHSGGSLFDHLVGVSQILKEMNAPQHVQDAGLFHSIYGTYKFQHQTISDRNVIQNLIGEEAEYLVYMFCYLGDVTNRQTEITNISDKKIRDELMLIGFANDEEMGRRREMTFEEAYNV